MANHNHSTCVEQRSLVRSSALLNAIRAVYPRRERAPCSKSRYRSARSRTGLRPSLALWKRNGRAHCGIQAERGYLYTLTLTDVATGWTECLPLLLRSQETVLAAR